MLLKMLLEMLEFGPELPAGNMIKVRIALGNKICDRFTKILDRFTKMFDKKDRSSGLQWNVSQYGPAYTF